MSNYSQTVFFAPKDLLPLGNPSKIIFGAQIDPELAAISVAIATKYDSSSIAVGQIAFAVGSAPAPSITFVGNLGTGLYLAAANSLGFTANGVAAGSISSAGAWSIPAPSSGTALTANAAAASAAAALIGSGAGVEVLTLNNSAGDMRLGMYSAGTEYGLLQANTNILNLATIGASTTLKLSVNAGTALQIAAAGNVTINAPSSGRGLTVNGVSGTHSTQIADAATNLFDAGYVDIPLNGQAAAYATVAADRGKMISHQSASAHTFTINDATVNYPIGATISFYNGPGSGVLTIALQTTATNLVWAPSGGTGNRTLTATGVCTATKVAGGTPGTWVISGVGLT